MAATDPAPSSPTPARSVEQVSRRYDRLTTERRLLGMYVITSARKAVVD